MLTEFVIFSILICMGISIYYFTCRRQEVADEQIILLD